MFQHSNLLIIVTLQAIAIEVQSESKWKQLGELAMSSGKVQLSILSFIIYYGFLYHLSYIITLSYMPYYFLQLDMAEECLLHATDLSGLLLFYSSLGDAEGITKLASVAEEQGKNNVAFLCFFMLGKLEECLQLLVQRYRHWGRTILFNTFTCFNILLC
jgi:coatomer subunit beta'